MAEQANKGEMSQVKKLHSVDQHSDAALVLCTLCVIVCCMLVTHTLTVTRPLTWTNTMNKDHDHAKDHDYDQKSVFNILLINVDTQDK